MTIQGGGGPKGPKPPAPPAIPPTTKAEKTEKAPSSPPAPSSSPPPKADGFEKAHTDPGRHALERTAFTATEMGSTSGIESMVRILEETRAQILDEHKALREKSIALVKQLAAAGFEKAILEQKKSELAELRERLAHLRKRLQHIQRRLKTALGKTQKHGDVDAGKQIAAHLDKMKKLEPGLQKALLALHALEQACAGVVDGGVLKLIGDATAEERGAALARFSPGSLVARAVSSVLTSSLASRAEQPALPPSSEGAPIADKNSDGLDGLREITATLLTSLEK